MSKKHFQALADALKYRKPEQHWDANKMVQWKLDVQAVAGVCELQNARFDTARFLKACGMEEGS